MSRISFVLNIHQGVEDPLINKEPNRALVTTWTKAFFPVLINIITVSFETWLTFVKLPGSVKEVGFTINTGAYGLIYVKTTGARLT